MDRETSFSRVWKWTVQCAPLWWGLGVNLGVYHTAALLIFFNKISQKTRAGQGIFIPATALSLAAVFCAYLAAIVIHHASGDMGRLIAAVYNLSFWAMGFILVIGLANIFSVKTTYEIGAAFRWPAWVSGFLSFAVFVLWLKGAQGLEIRTPFYWVRDYLGNTALVENSVLIKPLIKDWFASSVRPRFNAFSPYATASGGVLMILLMMVLSDADLKKRLLRVDTLFLLAANTCALVMTLSRTPIAALFFAMAAVSLLQKKHSWIWIGTVIAFLLMLAPLLGQAMDLLLGLRAGSNETRLEIYRLSLQQLDGIDWVFGLGLKPRESFLDYPLGSHSTFVSIIYKSGLLGFAGFLWFQAGLLLRWYQLKKYVLGHRENLIMWRTFGWVFVSMSLWMMTEDIDAPQFLAFLYFSIIGIFEGFRRSLSRAAA